MFPFTPQIPGRRRRRRGFTLVEIMIVVVIIGFLAAMALPAFQKVRRTSQNNTFVNDLRQFRAAVDICTMDLGRFPLDGHPGNPGAELRPYLSANLATGRTPVGGLWDWDGTTAYGGGATGVSVVGPAADDAQMQEIDRIVDDGDTSTGNFRDAGGRYVYLME